MSTADTRSTPYAKLLRSSCRYCRRRKIKCDGTSPCGACQSRRMDCVHDERAKMGRPAKASAVPSPGSSAAEEFSVDVRMLTETAFDDAFRSSVPTTAFSAALHSYMTQREVDLSMLMDEHAIAEQKACEPDVYDALFPVLFAELLDTLQFHYDAGGQAARRRPTFLPLSLRIDPTARMYADVGASISPYVDAEDEVDVKSDFALWSNNHPFAACITVDALLQPDSAASRAIRQLVLLEARQMRGEERDPTTIIGQYRHAEQLFAQQRIVMFSERPADDEQVAASLLACQAALLFSWHELAHTHAKRGIAYMAVAGQLMGLAQANSAELAPSTQATMHLVSSFLSLATVWSFSQLDRSTGNVDFLTASDQSRPSRAVLMSAAARLSSLLLNGHPAVLSSSGDGQLDSEWTNGAAANLSSLALRLYPAVNTMQLVWPGDAIDAHTLDLIDGYREAVQLMLLRCASSAKRRSANDAALLSVLHTVQARIVRLAGPLPTAPSQPTLLAKLAYDRRSPSANLPPDPDAGLKKTMAAYLFASLASTAAQRWDGDSDGDDVAVSYTWQRACATLASASLDLLTTPTLQAARDTFRSCADRLAGHDTATTSSSAHTSPPTAATSILDDAESPMKLADASDEDVFSVLWGFVPWSDYEA